MDVRVFKQLTVVDPEAEEEIPLEELFPEKFYKNYDEDGEEEGDAENTVEITEEDFIDENGEPIAHTRKHGFNERTEITLEQAREISGKYNLGDIVEIEVKPKNFGRISAQTAKQVIIQGIREAERDIMVREY